MGDRPDYTGSVVIEGSITIASGTVSISGTVTVSGNVVITSGTVNIQTAAGVEVYIGKKETTPIGRLISNDAGAGQWLQSIAQDKYGKFFPNGMRGQLHNIPIYVKNATAGAVNLVLKYAVRPLMPDQFSTTTSIPATFEGWVNAAVAKYWDFDSLFVYAENATLSIGMDTPASDLDADCFAYISGAWQWLGYRPWIRANLKVQAHYPVTVEGSVSTYQAATEISDINQTRQQKGYVCADYVKNLAAGALQFSQLKNPSGSGKTIIILRATLFADYGATWDAGVYDSRVTEADATGGLQTILTRYVGGAAGVATVRWRATTGVPAGWIAGQWVLGVTSVKVPTSISFVLVIPAGQGCWYFMRNNTAAIGNAVVILEWIEI